MMTGLIKTAYGGKLGFKIKKKEKFSDLFTMMIRYYTISTAILILVTLLVTLKSDLVSGKTNKSREAPFDYSLDNIEELENLIIIQGIQINPEVFKKNDRILSKGVIIYDNTFDDSIVELKRSKVKRIKNKSQVKKSPQAIPKGRNNSLISVLKKKNFRWHLTPHLIKSGENLWVISKKYKIDHRLIIRINNIKNPDVLKTGNTILVPNKNGITYKVKRGDTLSRISKNFRIDVNKIILHNKIKGYLIKIGKTIFIPDAVPEKSRKKENIRKRHYKQSSTVITKKGKTFLWPVKGHITSAFGKRVNPITKKKKFHCGIDISSKVGTPVKASASGKVIFCGWKDGYGKVVILKHASGYITVYAHTRKNLVKVNNKVKSGDIIAYSGSTGAVTGPHLHFEIRKFLTPLNPLKFLGKCSKS